MSHLNEWVYVSQDEKPYVKFEESLEVDQVASGYVLVKATLEVFDFLREAAGLASPRGRAINCHGTCGSIVQASFEVVRIKPILVDTIVLDPRHHKQQQKRLLERSAKAA